MNAPTTAASSNGGDCRRTRRHRNHGRRVPALTRRLSLLLAGLGLVVAVYLLSVQLELADAWDPLFGAHSSASVLRSSFSKSLPVPDSSLGVAGYACELVLLFAIVRGFARRSRHRIEVAYRWLAAAMAAGGAALVVVQAFVVGHWCSLCLASAALSAAIAVLAWTEPRSREHTSIRRGRASSSASQLAGS